MSRYFYRHVLVNVFDDGTCYVESEYLGRDVPQEYIEAFIDAELDGPPVKADGARASSLSEDEKYEIEMAASVDSFDDYMKQHGGIE